MATQKFDAGREDGLSALLGKTLPEAQQLCPGMHFMVKETNGRFAEGAPRVIRARRAGEGAAELVLSRFKDLE